MSRGGAPGWERLWRHSLRLGVSWAVREARKGWPYARVGVTRLLVPMDPWRYYELGRVADADFSGRCLDISSPKLLPSLLQREGRGEWLCIDLFEREIKAWQRIDPLLALEVQDATDLPYGDCTFRHIACISVLEHIGHSEGQDAAALAEAFRVLEPGGLLHLTTDIRHVPQDVFVGDKLYGEASRLVGTRRIFFKHDYSPEEIATLVGGLPWEVELREFAVQRDPRIEERFYSRAPLSYAYGPFLRCMAPRNFRVSTSPDLLAADQQGVVYFQLRKPATGPADATPGQDAPGGGA